MAWLTGWNNRRSHLIYASSGAGTNYPIGIKVYKGTGSPTTELVYGLMFGVIYCSDCLDNFGDIRFTDDTGTYELDYWMEEYTSGTSATFWVEIEASLESTNRTIYVYWDKSDATTTSSGPDTFMLFDDFATFDTGKWTKSEKGGGVVGGPSSSLLELNVNPYVTSDSAGIKSIATFTNDIDIRIKRRQTTNNGYYIMMTLASGSECDVDGGSTSYWLWTMFEGYHWRQYEPANATGTNGIYRMPSSGAAVAIDKSTSMNSDNANFHIYEGKYFSNGDIKFLLDAVTLKWGTDTTYLSTSKMLLITQGSYYNAATGEDTRIEWVMVRKCISTEPVHGTWGSEESSIGPFSISLVTATPSSTFRTGANTIVLACTFYDPSQLGGSSYTSYFWIRDKIPTTLGPLTATTYTTIGSGSFTVRYSLDPSDTYSLGSYDVRALVYVK